MKLLLLAISSILSGAENWAVGTIDASEGITFQHTATKTSDHIQDAMDNAACGDFVYVEPFFYTSAGWTMRRSCPANNPVHMRSGKASWIPCATCRVTPAMIANMPILAGTFSNGTLSGIRDGDGTYGNNPPGGFEWVGFAFTTNTQYGSTYFMVRTGGGGSQHQLSGQEYWVQNEADLPHDITFDRCVFFHRFIDLSDVDGSYCTAIGQPLGCYDNTTLLVMNGTNIVIKHSYVWPFYGGRPEDHAIGVFMGGSFTLQDSFVSAPGIPVFAGGAPGDYPASLPQNFLIEDNSIFKALWKNRPRYWTPAGNGGIGDNQYGGACTTIDQFPNCYALVNPHPEYYELNLARHGGGYKWACQKNLMEFKLMGGGATIRRNVFDTQPMDGGGNCGSQNNGFTNTPRAAGYHNPVAGGGADGPSRWMDGWPTYSLFGTLTTNGTDFTWKSLCGGDANGNPPYCGQAGGWGGGWIQAKHGLCAILNPKSLDSGFDLSTLYVECQKIASITFSDVTGAVDSVGVLSRAFTEDLNHPHTTLSAGIDASTLTIPVASTTGFSTSHYIRIGSEYMAVCALTSNTFTACSRGGTLYAQGSTAASHSNGASVDRVLGWIWNYDIDGRWESVTTTGNVFRNVATGMTILGRDRFGWTQDSVANAGRITNLTIRNNKFEDIYSNWKHGSALKMQVAEGPSKYLPTNGASNVIFENNTYKWPNAEFVVFGLEILSDGFPQGAGLAPRFLGSKVRGNIFPETSFYDNTFSIRNTYNHSYSGMSEAADTEATSDLQYNVVPNTNLTQCGSVPCAGVLAGSLASKVTWKPNTAKLEATSTASRASFNGRDMGVDDDTMPEITDIKVIPGTRVALLKFHLKSVIAAASCTLEVSPNEELQSMVGLPGGFWTVPYTNIAELNASYFRDPNHSNRTNSLLNAVVTNRGDVSWPIGQNNAAVTGDDGNSHDLRLTPNTPYWGMLMCGGDTQFFNFTTRTTSLHSSMPMRFTPAAGTGSVKIEYGSTYALGSSVTHDVSTSVSFDLTAAANSFIYYRQTNYSAASGGGSVLYPGPIELAIIQ